MALYSGGLWTIFKPRADFPIDWKIGTETKFHMENSKIKEIFMLSPMYIVNCLVIYLCTESGL